MWQTQIEVMTGAHIPYFPGMDWNEIECYKQSPTWESQRKSAQERNIEQGKRTNELVLNILAEIKQATVKDLMKKTGMTKTGVQQVLNRLLKDEKVEKADYKIGRNTNVWVIK